MAPARRLFASVVLCCVLAVAVGVRVEAACAVGSDGVGCAPADVATCTMPQMRPPAADRKFTSTSVNAIIASYTPRFLDGNMATLFSNCLPNTLDTTVLQHQASPLDTFIITGDIAAMWLRDSANQVAPYVAFNAKEASLQELLAGVIARHARSVILDPYANAFQLDGEHGAGPHMGDQTTKPAFAGTSVDAMTDAIYERKYELDSLINVIHLATSYYNATGDKTPFDSQWVQAMQVILQVLQTEQQVSGSPYSFQRMTTEPTDSLEHGVGPPISYTGMIRTCFRPSDDHATFSFNIPANAYAVVELRRLAGLLSNLGQASMSATASSIASQADEGIKKYGVMQHPVLGQVYAYEVDGFGNQFFMDDANIPSLLSLPYLGYVSASDPLYLATRKGVLSHSNPYYYSGSAGAGIGGPHNGAGWIWPMSIMMQALTSTNVTEIKELLPLIVSSSACTGLMHESFQANSVTTYTRPWFAWANSLFGGLILQLANTHPELIFKT